MIHRSGRGGRVPWLREARLALTCLTLAFLAGCPRHDTSTAPVAPPPPRIPGPRVALPDGGLRHTERLALVGWSSAGAFWACSNRTEDFSKPGPAGRCLVVEAVGAPALPREWTDAAFTRDASAPDAAPGDCRVLFEDITGDPGLPADAAARAVLLGPGGRTPIDAWRPPLEVDGDYFAVETSFSPDGRRLAVVHTAVGRGEGEQSAEAISAEVRATPACRSSTDSRSER